MQEGVFDEEIDAYLRSRQKELLLTDAELKTVREMRLDKALVKGRSKWQLFEILGDGGRGPCVGSAWAVASALWEMVNGAESEDPSARVRVSHGVRIPGGSMRSVVVDGTVEDIVAKLKDAVRTQFGREGTPVFCFYERRKVHPTEFADSRLLVQCDRTDDKVYFWIKKAEEADAESPTKILEEFALLRSEFEQLKVELLTVKLSATAAAAQAVFDKRIPWLAADVEAMLRAVDVPAEVHEAATLELVVRLEKASVVPQRWADIFSALSFGVRRAKLSKQEQARLDQINAKAKKSDKERQELMELQERMRLECNIVNTHASSLLEEDGARHLPNFSCYAGPSQAWEALLWMAEFKWSFGTDFRDAVMQVFSRCLALFKHQPGRHAVVSVVLDCSRVAFVKVERGSATPFVLHVSDQFALFDVATDNLSVHGEWLLRFVCLSPERCGYVRPDLPKLMGVQMDGVVARGLATVVYRGADGKIYQQGPRAAAEAEMIGLVAKCDPAICPAVLGAEGDVVCIAAGSDVRAVLNAVDVAACVGELFWGLFQMHAAGVVHLDVKPANVLRMGAQGPFVFCDFDSAQHKAWFSAEERRASAGFADKYLFVVSDAEDWDLLGLYWTALYMVVAKAVVATREGTLSVRKWLEVRFNHLNQEHNPNPQLKWFLWKQLFPGPPRLTHPRALMARYVECWKKSKRKWVRAVRAMELQNGWFSCPEPLLERQWEAEKSARVSGKRVGTNDNA
jgi:hypothetical protein